MSDGRIIIFADGACLGNPGPGAAASIVADDHRVLEIGRAESGTTNNQMELLAVIQALKRLQGFKGASLHIHSDSQYVLNGIQKWVQGWKRRGWKTAEGADVKNQELWMELDEVVRVASRNFKLEWTHVAGHAGIPGNERCDEIANSLAEGHEVFLYDGSRTDYSVNLTDLVETKTPRSSSKPVKTTASTYYVSYVGGTVYRDKTWKECEARVKGARGAKYRKCNSAEEEREVLKSWGLKA